MRSLSLRSQAMLATGALLIVANAATAEACGWRCERDARVYGYNAYIAPRPPVRAPSRAVLLATPRVPGGSTTLDPPGLVTFQGVLESPVPGPRPGLLGSGSRVYGYTGTGWGWRRWHRRH